MKSMLRIFFPDTIWKQLRNYNKWIRVERKSPIAGKTFSLLNMYFTILSVFFKENIQIVRPLDFPDETILMSVNSSAETTRLYGCRKEPETIRWLREYIKPGDVFFDIGAHVATYSLVAWFLGRRQIRVFAFEPSATPLKTALENIRLNGAEKDIKIIPLALSSSNEIGNINQITLDTASKIFNLPNPTVVKIDVDGAEKELVFGGRKTLTLPSIKTVLIEITASKNVTEEIEEFFITAGFTIKEKHNRGHGDTTNYIFSRI